MDNYHDWTRMIESNVEQDIIKGKEINKINFVENISFMLHN